MLKQIIVGYDGSASSVAAAEWAASEAAARHSQLLVLSCTSAPILADGMSGASLVASDVDEVKRAALDRAQAIAADFVRRNPALDCRGHAALGAPRDVLVDASREADLVVVGRTGAGAVKSLVLGSVANSVVRRSHCPVVLVPTTWMARDRAVGAIAVGVDGSAASERALDWAIGEASVRGADLVLVHAWSFTYHGPVVDSSEARDAACAEAQATLDALVESATARAAGGCTIRGRLVEEPPALALLEQSESVDLLVVGSRGRSNVRELFFGSVAHAVTERATCPVAVIHVPKDCVSRPGAAVR